MQPLTSEQIDVIIDWMNTWDQLRDTVIPIRFKEWWKKSLDRKNEEYKTTIENYIKLYHTGVAKTYEYRVIDHDMLDNSVVDLMNKMGETGWEIFKIMDPHKRIDSYGLFMKTFYRRVKNLL